MERFVELMPKIELHAHLNGSLSKETMQKLNQLKYSEANESFEDNYSLKTSITLQECFQRFKSAHDLTDSVAAVQLATECAIDDFAKDNVIYVELRTTPRATRAMTKDEYISTVINAIRKMREIQPKVHVKLIISLNRSEELSSSAENVDLLLKYHELHPNIVCGVDMSGSPSAKAFADYKSLLEKVKAANIGLALHCGEIDNDREIGEMLAFGLNRIGHGTFIRGENESKLLKDKSVALECCLTSNFLCQTVSNFEDHHFKRFYEIGHPVVICTDDFGVFNTTLSKELLIAAQTFNLSQKDLIKLSETAIDHSFASSSEKILLKQQMIKFKNEINLEN